MPQYLVAIQHPENYDPSLEGEAMIRDIGALNQEMDAAGARFFAGGLESASHAKSLRKQPDGNVSITDGPYIEAKEHIGGFWILECADMDEALAWDAKPSSPAGFLWRCEPSSKSGRIENHLAAETRNEKARNLRTHLVDGVIDGVAGIAQPGMPGPLRRAGAGRPSRVGIAGGIAVS
jgi:hypothetical protein